MNKEKIRELVSQMTAEEKVALTTGVNSWETLAVERLGIPSMWMSDGPHGLRKQEGAQDNMGVNASIPAVSFPAECLAASSFDREVLRAVGAELGREAQGKDVHLVLGPGINMKRSPLCGRNFEYMSEDPLLAGELATAYIQGMQEQGAGACVKHFFANNQETRRMTGSSNVDERAIREIYLAAFERVIKQAKPWAVMTSYNRLNGVQMTENREYQVDVLRGEWDYDGCVISDWGAVHNRGRALAGGCDLTMPAELETNEQLVSAVRNGQLSEELVDTACEHILDLVFKGIENHKADSDPQWDKGHETVIAVAEESAVLLKNEDGILPLSEKQKLVFIGDFARHPRFQGGGSSHVNPVSLTSPLDEARKRCEIAFVQGYDDETSIPGGFGPKTPVNEALIAEAVEAAKAAEVAVVFAGLPASFETEGMDRTDSKMPESHNRLISAVAAANPNTVVVLFNGSSMEMPWADEVKGILEMYLPGEGVGESTTRLLFGNVNPSGRLPETFPRKLEDNPSSLSFPGTGNESDYLESVYIGYRYYESKKMPVLFPFGYGLSYSTFAYSNLSLSADAIGPEDTLVVSVDVTNTSDIAGKEVVQLYVAVEECAVRRPVKELRGFDKITLAPGETRTVTFTLGKRDFSYWNTEVHAFHMAGGKFEIQIGASASEVILSAPIKALEEKIARSVVIGMNASLGDMLDTEAGAAFFEAHKVEVIRGIIASGIAGDIIDASMTEEQMLAMSEHMDMAAGLRDQPVSVLRMFLPDLHIAEWEKLFNACNGL